MIEFPDIPGIIVMTPKGQMVVVGYYLSNSMGSVLCPEQFQPTRMVICEGMQYGDEGHTIGLKFETFEVSQVEALSWERHDDTR